MVANALASTRWSSSTTCGSEADRPEPTNRLMPVTIRAAAYSGTSDRPKPTAAAVSRTKTPRVRFATTRTRRRSQRSRSAPANGPTIEYGSSSTAKPAATAAGSAWRSGLNSTAPASPAWNRPSPHWEASLLISSLRNPATASSLRTPRWCFAAGLPTVVTPTPYVQPHSPRPRASRTSGGGWPNTGEDLVRVRQRPNPEVRPSRSDAQVASRRGAQPGSGRTGIPRRQWSGPGGLEGIQRGLQRPRGRECSAQGVTHVAGVRVKSCAGAP